MSSPFFKKSKEIANDFIQSIVFIDDKAFAVEERNPHEFNAQQITQTFAKSKKICAVYKPETSSDIDNIAQVAKKADISVIDWQINIEEEEVVGKGEEDAEEDEPRGLHTRKIIKEILNPLHRNESLKLIIIYTGEINLHLITDSIFQDLGRHGIDEIQKGECSIFSDKIKILVIAKPSVDNKEEEKKFNHNPELLNKIVTYEQLPEFILMEFTNMTCGLLSNFALKSLTEIRKNSSKLLSQFSKDLDPAFLTHKALLPNTEDAFEHIVDLIGSDIKSLIKGNNKSELLTEDDISKYIDSNFIDPISIKIHEKEKFKEVKFPDILTPNDLKLIIKEGINNFFIKNQDPFEEQQLFEKNCHKTLTSWFTGDESLAKKSNIRFASMTTLKSFHNEGYLPMLCQGTLLKDDTVKPNYWLCIQPKCDSVRIHTKKRDFLLLALKEVQEDKKYDIIINGTTYLKIDYSIYNSKLIPFKKALNGAVTPNVDDDGISRFEKGDNLKMIWLGELKNDFAQHISNTFAASIARVGMDHSEWLRRS